MGLVKWSGWDWWSRVELKLELNGSWMGLELEWSGWKLEWSWWSEVK